MYNYIYFIFSFSCHNKIMKFGISNRKVHIRFDQIRNKHILRSRYRNMYNNEDYLPHQVRNLLNHQQS